MGHSYHIIVIPSYIIQALWSLEVLWRTFYCNEVTCLIHRVCHDIGLDFGAKIKPAPLSEDPNFLNTQREPNDQKFRCHKTSLKIHDFQKNPPGKPKFWLLFAAHLRRRVAARKSHQLQRARWSSPYTCLASISNTASSPEGAWPMEWIGAIPCTLTMVWGHLAAILGGWKGQL